MGDVERVAALRAGDPRGLADTYDAYSGPLYAFCVSMLRDRDLAQDAVHDTFLIARERIGQLREASRLRAWLYAIARNECLRLLRAAKRATALDEAGDVPDETVNLDAGLRRQELHDLLWQAVDGLNPGERAAVELTLRHGVEGRDLAAVLGVTEANAAKLVTRSRDQLERGLACLIVARTGRSECAELAALTDGWDGMLTVLMRKRIGRHLDSCPTCGERRRRSVSAAALLAAVPILAAPEALRRRVVHDAGAMELVSMRRQLARRAGPFDRDGFPQSRQRRRPAIEFSVAAAVVLALGTTATLPAVLSDAGRRQPVAVSPPTATGSALQSATSSGSTAPRRATTVARTTARSVPVTPPVLVTPTVVSPTSVPPTPSSIPPVVKSATKPVTTPAPVPGTLTTSTPKLELGTGAQSKFAVTASGGTVTWSAKPDTAGVSLAPTGGTLAAGSGTSVVVAVDRKLAGAAGSATVNIAWETGSTTVTVYWSDPGPV